MLNPMAKPALLFDIGNVLLTFDFAPAWQHFSEASGLAQDELQRRIQPLKDALESGQMSSEAFVEAATQTIGYRGPASEFIFHWGNIFTLNAPMVEFLKQLDAEVSLFLFSNTSGLHKDFMFEHFEVFQRFEGGIYSHEAKAMKPEARMYELAVETLGLDPAKTLYVDDLAENVQTGVLHGFHTHTYDFRRHEAFLEAFKSWREVVGV